MHGEEHTDEIGMHTVLYSLQRMSRRDARQPRPPWSSLTLRRRTSDERAASRARVSESWRQSPQSNLRYRRRGVVTVVRAYVPPRNLDQHSGLREAPEGASSRGSTASLQGVGLTRLIVGTRPTVPSRKRVTRDWRCG